MRTQIVVQVLPAERLDDPPNPVDVDAVLPARARIGCERRVQRLQPAGARRRQPGRLVEARQLRVPHVVGVARGVRHQFPQCDGAPRRPQSWSTWRIEPVQHLRLAKPADDLASRLIQPGAALLDQLHQSGAGDRLGHRGNVEHRVQRDRRVAGHARVAERAPVDRFVGSRCHRHHAGDRARSGGLRQQPVDVLCQCHPRFPSIFRGNLRWPRRQPKPACERQQLGLDDIPHQPVRGERHHISQRRRGRCGSGGRRCFVGEFFRHPFGESRPSAHSPRECRRCGQNPPARRSDRRRTPA